MNRNQKYTYAEAVPDSVYNKCRELAKETGGNRVRQRLTNYLKITGRLYFKTTVEDNQAHHPYPLSKNYWRKVIGGRYLDYINELLQANIIEVEKKKGRNYYKIETNLLLTSHKLVSHEIKSKKKINDPEYNIENRLGKKIIESLNYVSFETELYNDLKSNGIINLHATDYKFDLIGLPNKYNLKGKIHYPNSTQEKHYTVETFRNILKDNMRLSCFYSKDKIILDDEINFIQRKRNSFIKHCNLIIEKLNSKSFELSRDNEKTRRIFNILVSLPSRLLPLIKIDEEPVVGLDIKTSQFLLFANLLHYFQRSDESLLDHFKGKRNTFIKNLYDCFRRVSKKPAYTNRDKSTEEFIDIVFNKDFYEEIGKIAGLENRGQSKIFAFSLLFSNDKRENEIKKKLSNQFPIVMDTINLFKKTYGYEQFSINLQALEAEIMIDKIFKRLSTKGINCFTRHDSIIASYSNRELIQNVIEDEYKKLGFELKTEIEDYRQQLTEMQNKLEQRLNEKDILQGIINRNTIDNIENFPIDDLYTILQLSNNHLQITEYNHLESRIIELQNNNLPLDTQSISLIQILINKLL